MFPKTGGEKMKLIRKNDGKYEEWEVKEVCITSFRDILALMPDGETKLFADFDDDNRGATFLVRTDEMQDQ